MTTEANFPCSSSVLSLLSMAAFHSIICGRFWVITKGFTHPYIFCALTCVTVALMEIAGDDDVYFLLDRQRGLRQESMEELRHIIFEQFGADKRVKGIEFMDRESTVCLDPADYLAYIVRERHIDTSSFRAQAGGSIIGQCGHGGWIPEHYLRYLVDVHTKNRSIEEIAANLAILPYFRGPQ